MKKNHSANDERLFDVCIICALPEEATAVIYVFSRQCNVIFEKGFGSDSNREFRWAIIANEIGETLQIQVSWPPSFGPLETGIHVKSILGEFRPRLAIMTGICAGDREKVKLGDLVVADRAFIYESGKIARNRNGDRFQLFDTSTWHPDQDVLQYAQMFDSWEGLVENLTRPVSKRQQREWLLNALLDVNRISDLDQNKLRECAPDWKTIVKDIQNSQNPDISPDGRLREKAKVRKMRDYDHFPFADPPKPTKFIGAIASGSAVRSDNPFKDIQVPVRKTLAIDMEGAAFYRAVADFPEVRSLLVKGVCDYADQEKDDSYHSYASLASAMFALAFIKDYVHSNRMPRFVQEHLGEEISITHLSSQDFNAHLSEIEEAFENEYLSQVNLKYSRLRMIGVRELRDVKQDINIAYVSLNLLTRGVENTETRFNAEQALQGQKHLTIRGPAGSGKSTLLSWITYQCSQGEAQTNPWHGCIPFYVSLRRLADEDKGQPDIRKFIPHTIDPRIWSAEPPVNWVQKVLAQGRGIVLLDAVDELPASLRPNFWDWVHDFYQHYPENRIYITSRYFPSEKNYGLLRLWDPPSSFVAAELMEMNDLDVRNFIINWHNAILDLAPDDYIGRIELQLARDSLPEKLAEPANRRVRELCRTPLLCALICALHLRESGYLPNKRIELYDRCCTMLIEERDLKRNIPKPVGPIRFLELKDKEMLLQRLALDMMRNKQKNNTHQVEIDYPHATDQEILSASRYQIEITIEEALSWIEPNITACDNERVRECSAQDILNYLIERTGLLREPTRGWIDFPHRTFQEYLAACAAGALNQVGFLVNCADDDQWHETIIMAAGTKVGGVPFGNNLIEGLISRGEEGRESFVLQEIASQLFKNYVYMVDDDGSMSVGELINKVGDAQNEQIRQTCFALAVACLETGHQIRKDLRKRVLKHLAEIVPPKNVSEAKALASAGDATLNYLEYEGIRDQGLEIIIACAHTISLIGSQRAAMMLLDPNGYGGNQSFDVLTEIINCPNVNPLQVPSMLLMLQKSNQDFTFEIKKRLAEITDISPLVNAEKLPVLVLKGFKKLTDVSPLSELQSLRILMVSECPRLMDLNPVSALSNLSNLFLSSLENVRDLTFVQKLIGLRGFQLINCEKIRKIYLPEEASNLRLVQIVNCEMINELEELLTAPDLRWLSISSCPNITNLDPLSHLSELSYLGLNYCNGVTNLKALSALSNLTRLDLVGCDSVTDISPLFHLPNLKSVTIADCKKIPEREKEFLSGFERNQRSVFLSTSKLLPPGDSNS